MIKQKKWRGGGGTIVWKKSIISFFFLMMTSLSDTFSMCSRAAHAFSLDQKRNNGSESLASLTVCRVDCLSKIIGLFDVPQIYCTYELQMWLLHLAWTIYSDVQLNCSCNTQCIYVGLRAICFHCTAKHHHHSLSRGCKQRTHKTGDRQTDRQTNKQTNTRGWV